MLAIKVRRAKVLDLSEIRQWLTDEDLAGVDGNFLCNWNQIERDGGKDLIVADAGGQVVGFMWGRMLRGGVIQVRNDWRRRGIATALVKHLCRLNVRNGELLLKVQCEPTSSVPFWRSMGFTMVGEAGVSSKVEGYRVLRRRVRISRDGMPIDVLISLYQEEVKWRSGVLPVTTVSRVGYRDGALIRFSEPVTFHSLQYSIERDAVIGIDVAGRMIYKDKARYEKASTLGIRHLSNGWYIESLYVRE